MKTLLKKYVYSGPPSAASLRLAKGETMDVQFHPGAEVELPPDHPKVMTMVARGLLKEVEEPAKEPEQKPVRKPKTPAKEGE